MQIRKALSFDDVTIEPRYSDIKRGEADVTPKPFRNIAPQIPIIASPMSSVSEYEMVKAMCNIQAGSKYQYKIGGLAVHHRYCSTEKLLEYSKGFVGVNDCYGWSNTSLPIAVGSIPSHKETIDKLLEVGHKFFCVDVANGTSKNALDTIKYIRKQSPYADIMSGNIATASQAKLCINAGANILRISIGSGSVCVTREITGCGVPGLQSIIDIKTFLNKRLFFIFKRSKYRNIILVCDGGIKNSGDLTKALAAGADYCILGKLLAGSKESPGSPFLTDEAIRKYNLNLSSHDRILKESIEEIDLYSKSHFPVVKSFFGMASAKALIEQNNKDPNHLHTEGVETTVPYTGPVAGTINKLINGLKQGLFYVGASNLEELKQKATFVEITNNGLKEGQAHGKAD